MARTRTDISNDLPEHQSDGELARRAANGDVEAFEELYRRHAPAAFRVAQRVTGNAHDASDAVSEAFTRVFQALPAGKLDEHTRIRPYLLTATRNAAIDLIRRAGRTLPSSDGPEPAQTALGPSEHLIDGVDSTLVAAAFRALPERWRSVLWLTEVEQIPARDAARLLGLSPNGAAQLAVRARAGLRERFLQAHIGEVPDECRATAQRLAAYVGAALSPRDVARVDQHLAACAGCRAREAELRDLGTTLRHALVPVGAGVSGLLGKVAFRLSSLLHNGAERLAAPVGAAAAGVLVVGVTGAAVMAPQQHAPASPRSAVQRPARPVTATPVATAAAQAQAPAPAATTQVEGTTASRTNGAQPSTAAPTPSRKLTPPSGAVITGSPAQAAPAPTTTTTTTTAPVASHTTTTTTPAPTTTTTTVPVTIPPVSVPPVTLPPGVTIPPVPGLPGVPGVPGAPGAPALPGLPSDLQLSSGLGALMAALNATSLNTSSCSADSTSCQLLFVLTAARLA
jgi:RNA polymerase sigma factor (sigma-70 family)